MISVTPAVAWEVAWVASHLRFEDAQEVRTVSGREPIEHLPNAVAASTQLYAIRYATPSQVDDMPLALFGVGDSPAPGFGLVWLLATPQVKKAVGPILQAAPHYLNLKSQDYPKGLHNVVDSRNASHLEWCRAVGLTPSFDYILIRDIPFHTIYRPRPEVFNV